jgi:hypothetical protein
VFGLGVVLANAALLTGVEIATGLEWAEVDTDDETA